MAVDVSLLSDSETKSTTANEVTVHFDEPRRLSREPVRKTDFVMRLRGGSAVRAQRCCGERFQNRYSSAAARPIALIFITPSP